MKLLPITLLILSITAATPLLPAADPAKDQAAALHTAQVADFISRVSNAKANANPAIYGKDTGKLTCIVYNVKQTADGKPAYTVVIATETGFAPMDDMVVICDTAAIDPASAIKCSGHVVYVQSGWINICGDTTTVQLGISKKERAVKITGPRKSDPM